MGVVEADLAGWELDGGVVGVVEDVVIEETAGVLHGLGGFGLAVEGLTDVVFDAAQLEGHTRD